MGHINVIVIDLAALFDRQQNCLNLLAWDPHFSVGPVYALYIQMHCHEYRKTSSISRTKSQI